MMKLTELLKTINILENLNSKMELVKLYLEPSFYSKLDDNPESSDK